MLASTSGSRTLADCVSSLAQAGVTRCELSIRRPVGEVCAPRPLASSAVERLFLEASLDVQKKEYGQTNRAISVIGFGGMRFENPDDVGACTDLICYAHERGINYFDTAPFYCDDKSETLFGQALQKLPRDSFFVSTKSGEHDGTKLREQLERSLTRLGLDRIDFFHIWCLMSTEDWSNRQRDGALAAALRAQQDGLVEHVVCSSHMDGNGIASVLDEGHFAGVTLGYNAINFPYREPALRAASERGVGVVAMNPLSGGLIPRNPERFAFLRSRGDSSVVKGALRFVVSHPAVTCALVGFAHREEVDAAVAVGHEPLTDAAALQAEYRDHIDRSFEDVCTGCQYCLPCPEEIPVPKLMDTYNALLLSGGKLEEARGRLKWHWHLDAEVAGRCTGCGNCEASCTQHLSVIDRLTELTALAGR